MSERRDPSGQGSQPSPIETSGEDTENRSREATGRGTLTSGDDQIATVRYTVTLIEQGSPLGREQGQVFTGHGILTPLEDVDIDPAAPELVLHLEDGRSAPIMIEGHVADRGYRFQVTQR